MLKIRRPTGRLIFNMGISIPGKTVFYIETGPSRHWHCMDLFFVVCSATIKLLMLREVKDIVYHWLHIGLGVQWVVCYLICTRPFPRPMSVENMQKYLTDIALHQYRMINVIGRMTTLTYTVLHIEHWFTIWSYILLISGELGYLFCCETSEFTTF